MSKKKDLAIRRKAKDAVESYKGFVAIQYFNFLCGLPLRKRIASALLILFKRKKPIGAK